MRGRPVRKDPTTYSQPRERKTGLQARRLEVPHGYERGEGDDADREQELVGRDSTREAHRPEGRTGSSRHRTGDSEKDREPFQSDRCDEIRESKNANPQRTRERLDPLPGIENGAVSDADLTHDA